MKVFKRILLGIGIAFGVVVIAMVTMVISISSVNASKGNHEEILKSTETSPKKALVIYQPSLSSITGDVAHRIAAGLNDNGFEVTLNNPGDHLSSDLSGYDVVVFGSPVYAGKVSDALNRYMAKASGLSACKTVLFSTGSSAGKSPELDDMEKQLNGAAVFKTIKFGVQNKEQAKTDAYDFGAELAK